MTRFARCAALATLLVLAACMSGPSAATDPAVSAVPPSPSVAPSIAASTTRADQSNTAPSVEAGTSGDNQARQRMEAAIAALRRPFAVRIGDRSFSLDSAELLLPDASQLLEQAGEQSAEIALAAQIDRQALRERLMVIAAEVDEPPTADVITDAEAYSSTLTFVRRPGRVLDVDAAVEQAAAALADPAAKDVTLKLSPRADGKLPFGILEHALQEHATYWRGTAGVYVYDLETGESAGVNQHTVFSGASVLKVPIMIYVYSKLGTLNQPQQVWMERMIGASGNYEATKLLAAAVGGWSTDDALVAVGEMSAMLRELGLEHTYMLVPYEGSAYLRREGRLPQGGPAEEGAAPFTAADPFLRTTPAEMARVFAMLDACAAGGGPLLEQFGARLQAAQCDEMLALLRLPHDQTRMVAGVPAGVSVAHKGGWTSDMQADVGIVDSPGGRYVAAIWVYRDLEDGYVTGPTGKASPYLADFSHTVYSFYNPEAPQ